MRIVDLKIEDIAFGGKGVARENGKAVFVPFTIDGERVSAQIVREKKQFAEAELVDLQEISPHRVKSQCPYFGRCGGCAYQHIAYEHQLAIKWRQVRDVLQRIGKIKDVPMRPIIPSPISYAYRNRITVHAQDGVIGFFQRDSHRLIDIERCPIAMDEANRALARLRASRVRDGHYTLRAEVDRLGRKCQSGPPIGRTRPAASSDRSRRYAAPPPELTTRSASGSVEPTAQRENPFHPFSQTNDAVASAMRDLIAGIIPPNQELLIDAYCGAGFLAKALLAKFERVIGIDWDKFAIAAARENASAKETYVAGEIEEALTRLLRDTPGVEAVAAATANQGVEAAVLSRKSNESLRVRTRATTGKMTLIVDPPATGLTNGICKTITRIAPANFIYVSCNPSTMARDLGELQRRFVLESVTPLDMFPQTAEIEVVAYLQAGSFK